jgi:hypothetical protein
MAAGSGRPDSYDESMASRCWDNACRKREPQGSGHNQENNLAIGEHNVKCLDVTPKVSSITPRGRIRGRGRERSAL